MSRVALTLMRFFVGGSLAFAGCARPGVEDPLEWFVTDDAGADDGAAPIAAGATGGLDASLACNAQDPLARALCKYAPPGDAPPSLQDFLTGLGGVGGPFGLPSGDGGFGRAPFVDLTPSAAQCGAAADPWTQLRCGLGPDGGTFDPFARPFPAPGAAQTNVLDAGAFAPDAAAASLADASGEADGDLEP